MSLGLCRTSHTHTRARTHALYITPHHTYNKRDGRGNGGNGLISLSRRRRPFATVLPRHVLRHTRCKCMFLCFSSTIDSTMVRVERQGQGRGTREEQEKTFSTWNGSYLWHHSPVQIMYRSYDMAHSLCSAVGFISFLIYGSCVCCTLYNTGSPPSYTRPFSPSLLPGKLLLVARCTLLVLEYLIRCGPRCVEVVLVSAGPRRDLV